MNDEERLRGQVAQLKDEVTAARADVREVRDDVAAMKLELKAVLTALRGEWDKEPLYVKRSEFVALRMEVATNTAWRQRVSWVIAGAAAAGGVSGGGIVAAIMKLAAG